MLFSNLMALVCCLAAGGNVRGEVVLPRGGPARDAVVCLEGGPAPGPLPHAVMDQREKTFIPHVLAVPVGTTVEFPNNDTVLHNVFAYFEAARFDLGQYPRGATKRYRFEKPGVVALLCNIHPDMSAYIVAVDTRYYAVTDSHGHFDIPQAPAGAYTLTVWHESGARYASHIEVTPNMRIPTVQLVRR